jgi:hypothetical protein
MERRSNGAAVAPRGPGATSTRRTKPRRLLSSGHSKSGHVEKATGQKELHVGLRSLRPGPSHDSSRQKRPTCRRKMERSCSTTKKVTMASASGTLAMYSSSSNVGKASSGGPLLTTSIAHRSKASICASLGLSRSSHKSSARARCGPEKCHISVNARGTCFTVSEELL